MLWQGASSVNLEGPVFSVMRTLSEIQPGQTLGRYEFLVPIAEGGMASVWAARLKGTRGFSKTVAVKTMLPSVSDDPQFEQMFLDEAQIASRIRHPNVVEIMDLGEQDEVLYLVMEWVADARRDLRFVEEHLLELRVVRDARQHRLHGDGLREPARALEARRPDRRHSAFRDRNEELVTAEGLAGLDLLERAHDGKYGAL
jgi:hypothetical protein